MFRKRVLVEWWGKLEPGELDVNSLTQICFKEGHGKTHVRIAVLAQAISSYNTVAWTVP